MDYCEPYGNIKGRNKKIKIRILKERGGGWCDFDSFENI